MRISDWSSDVCSSDLSLYIARRVNAWNRRFEVVIDDDSTITGKHYAALLQPKPVAIGSASGGDEHLFRRDGVTMPLAGQFDPALCLGDTLIADTCANPHALGFQKVFQRGRSEGRRGGKGCVGTCEHGGG